MKNVPSPCTGVCRIENASGHCLGCKRTMAEIVAWPSLSDQEKRVVLAKLKGRTVSYLNADLERG